MEDAAGRAYVWIKRQSPFAADRIDDVVHAVSEMERRGYYSHVAEFNDALLKPLKEGMNDVINGVRSTATCQPAQNPREAFILWNVLCFWLGVVLLFVTLLLPFGSALAEVLGCALRYSIAYTLHFVFIKSPNRQWLLVSLVLLGLYVSSCLFAGVAGVVFLLPAVISFTRAFANAILLFHAYSLYIMLEGGPDGREML